MLRAVQLGAGNIGRGFIGQLLYEAGYSSTFVDANESLVDRLARDGCYRLRLVGSRSYENMTVSNLTALSSKDRERVTAEIVHADLISVAVGVRALPFVAEAIAHGINERARQGRASIDILLCENQWHVANLMRSTISAHIADDAQGYYETAVGLVEAVIGRMVPAPTSESMEIDPLLVVAEPFKELPVDKSAFRAKPPKLPGLIEAENFPSYEARKLFLHNMSHAALAYVGYGKGHEFIWQCAADPDVASLCASCIDEIVPALVTEFHFHPAELRSFADDLMLRFSNKALGDRVVRVAAEPRRKLRSNDRLLGAAKLCTTHGIPPKAISLVIATALCYDNPADLDAVMLQQRRQQIGDRATLRELCENDADLLALA